MQKHAVMRNMAVHFYQWKRIPGRHRSSAAVKGTTAEWHRVTSLDPPRLDLSFSMRENGSESEGECARRREWMRAEIRCTSKTVFFLSLALWHVYGEASRMWGPAQHIHQTQRESKRVGRGRRRAKRIKFPQFHGTSLFFPPLSLFLSLSISLWWQVDTEWERKKRANKKVNTNMLWHV